MLVVKERSEIAVSISLLRLSSLGCTMSGAVLCDLTRYSYE
jgi:hypothetical protein